jgi:hypothetical protein
MIEVPCFYSIARSDARVSNQSIGTITKMGLQDVRISPLCIRHGCQKMVLNDSNRASKREHPMRGLIRAVPKKKKKVNAMQKDINETINA